MQQSCRRPSLATIAVRLVIGVLVAWLVVSGGERGYVAAGDRDSSSLSSNSPKIQSYTLHSQKVDTLFYRIAMSALLRAKLKALGEQVDMTERVVHTECHQSATTIVQQARCVTRLMDARDRKKRANADDSQQLPSWSAFNEDNPLRVFLKAILDTNWHNILPRLAFTPASAAPSPSSSTSPHLKIPRPRLKRSITPSLPDEDFFAPVDGSTPLPRSIANLRRIERFFKKAEICRKYMNQLNDEHEKRLNALNHPVRFNTRTPPPTSAVAELETLLDGAAFRRLSILSPRFMSLFDRPTNSESPSRPRFLSPDMFSFHDKGLFPLPSFFKMVLSDRREIHEWLDLLLQLSGASRQLDSILAAKRDEMQHVETQLYPKILELQATNRRWRQLEAKIRQSEVQSEQMRRRGYTFLSVDQADVIFDELPEHVRYTEAQKESMLEKKIRALAALDEHRLLEEHKARLNADVKPRSRRHSPFLQSLIEPPPSGVNYEPPSSPLTSYLYTPPADYQPPYATYVQRPSLGSGSLQRPYINNWPPASLYKPSTVDPSSETLSLYPQPSTYTNLVPSQQLPPYAAFTPPPPRPATSDVDRLQGSFSGPTPPPAFTSPPPTIETRPSAASFTQPLSAAFIPTQPTSTAFTRPSSPPDYYTQRPAAFTEPPLESITRPTAAFPQPPPTDFTPPPFMTFTRPPPTFETSTYVPPYAAFTPPSTGGGGHYAPMLPSPSTTTQLPPWIRYRPSTTFEPLSIFTPPPSWTQRPSLEPFTLPPLVGVSTRPPVLYTHPPGYTPTTPPIVYTSPPPMPTITLPPPPPMFTQPPITWTPSSRPTTMLPPTLPPTLPPPTLRPPPPLATQPPPPHAGGDVQREVPRDFASWRQELGLPDDISESPDAGEPGKIVVLQPWQVIGRC